MTEPCAASGVTLCHCEGAVKAEGRDRASLETVGLEACSVLGSCEWKQKEAEL